MATAGKPAKSPSPGASALQRTGPAPRPRDPDATDPGAVLEDFEDEGTVADVVEDAEADPSVGPGDKTQVYDSGEGADPDLARFKLVVLAGPKAGAEFELPEGVVTLGRGADNAISIPDVSVSRRHIRIEREGNDALRVTDLNSGNGTKINDERVDEAVLRDGDEVAVGDTVVQVMEIGAPAVKKGRARQPAAARGETGGPQMPTRGDLGRVKGPAKAPPPMPVAAGVSPGRKRIYVTLGVIMVVFMALGVLRNKVRERQVEPAPESDVPTEQVDELVSDGKRLAKKHQWVDAHEKFQAAAELVDDPGIARLVEQSKTEAEFEKQLAAGKKALAAGDFVAAKEKFVGVPQKADVYPQAQTALEGVDALVRQAAVDARTALGSGDREKARDLAQKVLAADASNATAQAVMADLDKKAKKDPVKVVVKTTPREETRPAPAPAANAAAVQAYLNGELPKAMKLAEDAGDEKLLKNLRAFQANYNDGIAKAQAQRAGESVKSLGAAARADREISQGKASKPGREVGKQLANMEYLLGIDCKGDEQLDAAARHFRAALEADPENELSKKMANKIYQRARDLFTEAYLIKGTEPERARKMFKKVADTLPADDEKQGKAKSWVEKLEGKSE